MNHILYVDTESTVCQEPYRLGTTLVRVDYRATERICRECDMLLAVHNEREAMKDKVFYYTDNTDKVRREGFISGLAVASGFWLVVTLLFILEKWVIR